MGGSEQSLEIVTLTRELGKHASSLASAQTIHEMARTLLAVVDEVLDVNLSGFYFFAPDTGELCLLAARGFTEAERREAERTAMERHPGWVLKTGEILHIPDVENDPQRRSTSSRRSFVIRSRLYIPVRVDDRVVGVLGLGSDQPYNFTLLHIETMQFAAAIAGAVYARLRAHGQLVLREERLNFVLEGASLGLWDWNVASGEVVFNRRWAEMLGYRLEDVPSHVDSWATLVHPADKAAVDRLLADHLSGGTSSYRSEHRLRAADGTWRWILDVGRVVQRSPEGAPLRVTGIHQDITREKNTRFAPEEHRNHLEERVRSRTRELEETIGKLNRYQEKLHKTTEAAILAEEAERRRIAVRVHDGLGQELTAVRIGLRNLHAQEVLPGAQAQIAALDQSLLLVIGRVRDLTADLSPAVLYQFGIVAALEDLMEKTRQRYGLETRFRATGAPVSLSQDLEVILFSAARELVHNAVKHSRARHLWLYLVHGSKTLHIRVEDDGVGYTEPTDTGRVRGDQGGFGLFSIRERLVNVGGTMATALRAGGGSVFTLLINLERRYGQDS